MGFPQRGSLARGRVCVEGTPGRSYYLGCASHSGTSGCEALGKDPVFSPTKYWSVRSFRPVVRASEPHSLGTVPAPGRWSARSHASAWSRKPASPPSGLFSVSNEVMREVTQGRGLERLCSCPAWREEASADVVTCVHPLLRRFIAALCPLHIDFRSRPKLEATPVALVSERVHRSWCTCVMKRCPVRTGLTTWRLRPVQLSSWSSRSSRLICHDGKHTRGCLRMGSREGWVPGHKESFGDGGNVCHLGYADGFPGACVCQKSSSCAP